MSTINVQFSDASQSKIAAFFAVAQEQIDWPNQGVLDTADARWETFYKSLATVSQNGLPDPS
jgi:hypothetical protein